jgi:hypothetical protein
MNRQIVHNAGSIEFETRNVFMTFEYGYTPNNLKNFLNEHNLTQKDAYTFLGKGRNTFARYLLEVDNKNHVSMAHRDWLQLLEIVNENKE